MFIQDFITIPQSKIEIYTLLYNIQYIAIVLAMYINVDKGT